jgi:flavin-dependent dehydrogenase
MLVGDAAGHVKSTTGGGVVMGGLCAIEGAKVACRALENDDFSGEFLYNYDREWKKKYDSEFNNMLKGRRVFERLTDDNFESLVKNFKTPSVTKALNNLVRSGDMDLHGGVITKALREPALIFALTKSLGSLALWEIRNLIKV